MLTMLYRLDINLLIFQNFQTIMEYWPFQFYYQPTVVIYTKLCAKNHCYEPGSTTTYKSSTTGSTTTKLYYLI